MRLQEGYGKALVLGGCLAAFGCSAGISVTPQAPQARTYQVQAVDDATDPGTIIATLPASISAADAARMLVTIKQDQIRDGATYRLQDTGVAHHDWMRSTGEGWISGFSRHRDRDRDDDRDNRRSRIYGDHMIINSSLYSYYPRGNFYFPYSLIGNVYYPYTSGCAAPFLYRTRDFYSPYSYLNCGTSTPVAVPVPSGV